MKRTISRFILSSVAAFSAVAAYAQDEPEKFTTRGLRFGIDASPYVENLILPERTGWEAVADYQLRREWFIATEFGYQAVNVSEENFNYDLSGSYLKLGFDYDILKSVMSDDIITFGLRYGLSPYKHSASNIVINNYWGDLQGSFSEQSFNAHWLELVFGMKTELWFAKNVFMGWSVRGGFYLFGKRDERMDAFLIPGYGKGDKGVVLNYNWTLMYRIPFKKEIIPPKEKK